MIIIIITLQNKSRRHRDNFVFKNFLNVSKAWIGLLLIGCKKFGQTLNAFWCKIGPEAFLPSSFLHVLALTFFQVLIWKWKSRRHEARKLPFQAKWRVRVKIEENLFNACSPAAAAAASASPKLFDLKNSFDYTFWQFGNFNKKGIVYRKPFGAWFWAIVLCHLGQLLDHCFDDSFEWQVWVLMAFVTFKALI